MSTTPLENVFDKGKRIVKLINQQQIFDSPLNIRSNKSESRATPYIEIIFSLDDEHYCQAGYTSNASTGNQIQGTIIYVASGSGNKIGSFLLQLHLLMAYMSNVQRMELDNMTDNPQRASTGIYRDFSFKEKGFPEMYYKQGSNSISIVLETLKSIVDEQKKKERKLLFWNNYDGINDFIKAIKQNSGGKKKNKTRRDKKNKTKRHSMRHRRRKSNKRL